MIEILKPDFTFTDERGCFSQLVHDGYKQYNVFFSKKDIIRGNHYHKENKEVFFVIAGSFTLTVSKDDQEENYTFKQGDMFLIPPYVMHSLHFIEDTWIASMYDIGVEHSDGTKDIYAD